ncbi:MAG: hypothetical protein LN410_02330 [Candidatus Thermoplasmatota archaeon]|nr:hypothetical protein [Candidatus Thermoplasmatota archaeon]
MAEESQGSRTHERAGSNAMARAVTWRIMLSISLGTTWIAGILIYWAFFSERFTLFQNIIVAVASFLAVGGIIGAAWVSTGLRSSTRRWE